MSCCGWGSGKTLLWGLRSCSSAALASMGLLWGCWGLAGPRAGTTDVPRQQLLEPCGAVEVPGVAQGGPCSCRVGGLGFLSTAWSTQTPQAALLCWLQPLFPCSSC